MMTGNIRDFVPQLRPHNNRRDNHVHFMISRRPMLELSPEDVSFYDSIDGHKTVGELEQTYPQACQRLLQWHDAFALELIPPTDHVMSPHIVVIEPHMDDAVLSAGGRLLHRRGASRITTLSVVKWSNYTSYLALGREFLDIQEVTQLRLREAELVAKMLGAGAEHLDWRDAQLRFWPVERWSRATIERFSQDPAAFITFPPSPKDIGSLAENLARILIRLQPDELWIPMGIGYHVDHRMTRSACLRMLADAHGQLGHVPVCMYEDVPYALTPTDVVRLDSWHTRRLLEAGLASHNVRLRRSSEDITDVFKEKLRLVSIYASQFKVSYMEPRVRKVAEREAGGAGRLAEAFHYLEGKRNPPLESSLSPIAPALSSLKIKASSLLRERTKIRRLTVMVLPTGSLGRWKANSETLAAAFPNARFSVYAPETVAWQAEAGGSKQANVRIVRRGRLGCLMAVLGQLFDFRTPTVVLTTGAYSRGLKYKMIKALLPFRLVLHAKILCDFCWVLNEQFGDCLQ